MTFAKVALDGRFVRLEPLEERHREAIRPAAQHPEIFTVTTSALGPLFDPYIDNALKRSTGEHELAFAVQLKAEGRYVGMTRYLNVEAAHKQARDRLDLVRARDVGRAGQPGVQAIS